MSEWKKVKLQDCCHSISDGDHLPPPKSESGVPFITITIRDVLWQELPESYSEESINYYRDTIYNYVSQRYGGVA